MTPGQIARGLLGRHFAPLGDRYRRFFIDLNKVAGCIAAAITPDAKCLDIGGGDGMIANALLDRRSDISITMIDVASSIGGFLDAKLSDRVTLLPATPLSEFTGRTGNFDAVLITDVLHHIPSGMRPGFFADIRRQMETSRCSLLIVKEFAPGGLRSRLGMLSDKYITGDRHVALLAPSELRLLVEEAFGAEAIKSFEIEIPDPPNYLVVIRLS